MNKTHKSILIKLANDFLADKPIEYSSEHIIKDFPIVGFVRSNVFTSYPNNEASIAQELTECTPTINGVEPNYDGAIMWEFLFKGISKKARQKLDTSYFLVYTERYGYQIMDGTPQYFTVIAVYQPPQF
jgi:hypothetical protein